MMEPFSLNVYKKQWNQGKREASPTGKYDIITIAYGQENYSRNKLGQRMPSIAFPRAYYATLEL